MGQILIRNVDDETIESYKARARLKGHSLEQELRNLPRGETSRSQTQRPLSPPAARRGRCKPHRWAPLTLDEIREGLE